MSRECLSPTQLGELLDDGLEAAARQAGEEHLSACEECQSALLEISASEQVQSHWRDLWQTRTVSIRGGAEEPNVAFVQNLKATLIRERIHSPGRVLPAIPGYEILGEVGAGGSAIVYRARQLSLNRLVALKVILAGQHLRPDRVARFRAEAEAVARLQHPNIIQIHEVGQAGDLPYLALEWLDGGSLARKVRDEKLTAAASAALVETLARAMQFAHDRGIVHRDLKPGNILLKDKADGLFPKIADFGLAKSLIDGESGLTQSGDVLGTPSYMAPEQARPGTPVGPSADIYALGAILYELLSGQPPFMAATPIATLAQVVNDEPPRLPDSAPRDLETIALKCLDKDPARRYASAVELADDLGRFQRGEPIRARPVSDWEALCKWARRRPAIAGLAATVALVTLLGLAGVTVAFLKARTAQRSETRQRLQAEADREHAERSVYFGLISQARSQWLLNSVGDSERLLEQCPPERRGWEWHYLDRINHADRLTIPGQAGPFANAVAYSRDRRNLFVAGGNPFAIQSRGYLRAYDLKGQLAWEVEPLTQLVWSVAVSPDGQLLASAGGPWALSGAGEVTVRDAATGRIRFTVPGLESISARGIAFDATGRQLAFALSDHTIRVWDVPAQREIYRVEHGATAESVAFSGDGRILATGGFDGTRIWDTATRKLLATLPQSGSRFALHPDGTHVACAGETAVRIWDIREPSRPILEQMFAGHDGAVFALAYSIDGRTLATAGADGTVRLWEARTGRGLAVYRGHRGRAVAVAFHPDGRELASAGQQPGEVKVWDLTQPQDYTIAVSTGRELLDTQAIRFADDETLQVLALNGSLRLWSSAAGSRLYPRELPLRNEWLVPSTTAAFSGDGHWLAAVPKEDETRLAVWNLSRGQHVHTLADHSLKIWHVASDRSCAHIAAAAFGLKNGEWTRGLTVWDQTTGAPAFSESAGNCRTTALALSPDGAWLAEAFVAARVRDDQTLDWTGGTPGLRLIALTGSVPTRFLWSDGDGLITALAFDASGAKLAAARDAGAIRIWHTGTAQPLHDHPITGLPGMGGLAFHPDGLRLAGVNRERLQLWDVLTGQSILTLRGAEPRPHDNGFNPRVAWSPDGQKLAASQWNRTVSIWTAEPSK